MQPGHRKCITAMEVRGTEGKSDRSSEGQGNRPPPIPGRSRRDAPVSHDLALQASRLVDAHKLGDVLYSTFILYYISVTRMFMDLPALRFRHNGRMLPRLDGVAPRRPPFSLRVPVLHPERHETS